MSDRNEALRLADELHRVSTICDHHYSLDRAAASELERLVTDRKVLINWIAEALPVLASIDGGEFMVPLKRLIESGRRLVDGGPDDLLAGVE